MYVEVSRFGSYIRVRIVEKVVSSSGGWTKRLVEHIGSAHTSAEVAVLRSRAQERLVALKPQLSLFPAVKAPRERMSVSGSFCWGLWEIVGGLYDRMGLPGGLLKYLVLARIALPKSKLATSRWLFRELGMKVSASAIYKFMDGLDKGELMCVLSAHAQRLSQQLEAQAIAVVFYDVTTLYFETDQEDSDEAGQPGLRRQGYSKDHRNDLPQVVVGLTVDCRGFPLDFQVYEGNVYEGGTLLEGIRSAACSLSLAPSEVTVVADAGMLSKKNAADLESEGYRYIVGARLRAMSASIIKRMLDGNYEATGSQEIALGAAGQRLIVTYSDKRAARSRRSRQRLIEKLRAQIQRGQALRKSKYVSLAEGKTLHASIDQAKVDEDARFDGLKGYVTNTTLAPAAVVEKYNSLSNVEKSFRMSKSDLQARPAFHYRKRRVLAHLLICVCALGVLKELERQIAEVAAGTGLSVALEEILAIRRYTLKTHGNPPTDVYSELSSTQELLMRLATT